MSRLSCFSVFLGFYYRGLGSTAVVYGKRADERRGVVMLVARRNRPSVNMSIFGVFGWCYRQLRTPGEHRVNDENIALTFGVKRPAPLWRIRAGLTATDWTDVTDPPGAQAAVADYRPTWWTNSSAAEFGG
jgi:hypothetical protein